MAFDGTQTYTSADGSTITEGPGLFERTYQAPDGSEVVYERLTTSPRGTLAGSPRASSYAPIGYETQGPSYYGGQGGGFSEYGGGQIAAGGRSDYGGQIAGGRSEYGGQIAGGRSEYGGGGGFGSGYPASPSRYSGGAPEGLPQVQQRIQQIQSEIDQQVSQARFESQRLGDSLTNSRSPRGAGYESAYSAGGYDGGASPSFRNSAYAPASPSRGGYVGTYAPPPVASPTRFGAENYSSGYSGSPSFGGSPGKPAGMIEVERRIEEIRSEIDSRVNETRRRTMSPPRY